MVYSQSEQGLDASTIKTVRHHIQNTFGPCSCFFKRRERFNSWYNYQCNSFKITTEKTVALVQHSIQKQKNRTIHQWNVNPYHPSSIALDLLEKKHTSNPNRVRRAHISTLVPQPNAWCAITSFQNQQQPKRSKQRPPQQLQLVQTPFLFLWLKQLNAQDANILHCIKILKVR